MSSKPKHQHKANKIDVDIGVTKFTMCNQFYTNLLGKK